MTKGRPTDKRRATVLRLLATPRTVDELIARTGARRRSIYRWLAQEIVLRVPGKTAAYWKPRDL